MVRAAFTQIEGPFVAWTDKGLAQLAAWGDLTVGEAEAAGMFEVETASVIFPEFKPEPAIVIPYFDRCNHPVTFVRDGTTHPFLRVRYIGSPTAPRSFVKQKVQRYGQPAGSGVKAYFPRITGVDWERIAQDIKLPRVITEGEAKALVACLRASVPTIALGGVNNFLTSKTKDLIPELASMVWRGSDAYIAFDSDVAINPNIQGAEAQLVDELMRSRGAKCHLVRIPYAADGSKQGIDDFIAAEGADAFCKLLDGAEPLGAVDSAVVAMNRYLCWIERDGLPYDLKRREFLQVNALRAGSSFSAQKVRKVITSGRSPGVKEVQVANEWLTHTLARRYSDLLFRPGEGALIQTPNGDAALNVWHGWDAEEGAVSLFLKLDRLVMSKLPPKLRDFPLKLMAYKAQNPEKKIPLALLLVGDQGSGKSLWADCIAQAFAPYSVPLQSDALTAQFQGWLERSLIAVIDEAESPDIIKGYDRLKTMISEINRPMNEKYRKSRDIKSYTLYILTANKRAAGSFPVGDRRMVVIGCPDKKEFLAEEEYIEIVAWRDAGGGKCLMHYLLTYDLKGWRPPQFAPQTAEKALAGQESLTQVQELAHDMTTATEHTLLMWINDAVAWANSAAGGGNPALAKRASEIITSYSALQIRPWYTAEELVNLHPAIASGLYGDRHTNTTTKGEMSRQLRDSGIRFLECSDDPTGFLWRGRRQQFLVVYDADDWRMPLSQKEFDRLMKQWPRYGDLRKGAV